jgi:hypothetical protein
MVEISFRTLANMAEAWVAEGGGLPFLMVTGLPGPVVKAPLTSGFVTISSSYDYESVCLGM